MNTISIDATCAEAVRKMLGNTILCVTDANDRVTGVITCNDLINLNEKENNIKSIINNNFEYVRLDSIEIDLPKCHHTHIPVLDENGRLVYIYQRPSINNYGWKDAQIYEERFWENIIKNNPHEYNGNKNFKFTFINERFSGEILKHTANKTCLEIGPGPFYGYLPTLSAAKRRIMIEPLEDKYRVFRERNSLEINDSANIESKTYPADYFDKSLEDKIDGIIISTNALDHTPNWMFVLNNISSYAAKGCYLFLWTDIDHAIKPSEGHFEITNNPVHMFRLIKNMGFELIYQQINFIQHTNLNICCVGVKR